MLKEKEPYKSDQDLIQQWVNEYCEVGPSYKEKSSVLFESFKNYCFKNNEYPYSQTSFGRTFSKKFNKKMYGGTIAYLGVRLKNNI